MLAPARSLLATSTATAVFHESATRGEVLTWVPLTHTSTVSSPVTTLPRKKRVAAGTPAAGSPSGYQIQFAPPNPCWEPGWPMKAPCHSEAGFSRAVSKERTAPQPPARPWVSQTLTRQKYFVFEASARPA